MPDIRDNIFDSIADRLFPASIIALENGILSGSKSAIEQAATIGIKIDILDDGSQLKPGREIAQIIGRPKQTAMAEETLAGLLAKPSGIATAAKLFKEKAGGKARIVSGAWKKMPGSQKEMIRNAVVCGGVPCRVTGEPFIYLDKNYIKMFGGIRECLTGIKGLEDLTRVVQLNGFFKNVADEAVDAAQHGAGIIFIDSGRSEDVTAVSMRLRDAGFRERVKIAFSGGITLKSLDEILALDAEILDVGRAIIDAPLIDMRLEVRLPD